MNCTDITLEYYNNNASNFIQSTVNVDFSTFQNEFMWYVKANGNILDLGCGSGRDSKVFLQYGYNVTMIDGSENICNSAKKYTNHDVICSQFQNYYPQNNFDGIWACASLLHLDDNDLKLVLNNTINKLNENGCFYLSFKYGINYGIRNGRFFNDMTEEKFFNLIQEFDKIKIKKYYVTSDVRCGRSDEKWLNIFLEKVI